jgi:hypothetical protein
MTTLYTIDDHGEITSGLTAVEAATILLNDDSADFEIRAGEECTGILKGERHYELWTRKQVANKPWSKTVISVIADTEEAAETEIAEKVIRSGHWTKGELDCRTDEQNAAMMAELAADQVGEDAWYLIGGSNLQAIYAYGTANEADRYCDALNDGREINLCGAHPMTADEIADRPHIEDEGFNLDDELAARAGLR